MPYLEDGNSVLCTNPKTEEFNVQRVEIVAPAKLLEIPQQAHLPFGIEENV